jgi:hypothetical protein
MTVIDFFVAIAAVLGVPISIGWIMEMLVRRK